MMHHFGSAQFSSSISFVAVIFIKSLQMVFDAKDRLINVQHQFYDCVSQLKLWRSHLTIQISEWTHFKVLCARTSFILYWVNHTNKERKKDQLIILTCNKCQMHVCFSIDTLLSDSVCAYACICIVRAANYLVNLKINTIDKKHMHVFNVSFAIDLCVVFTFTIPIGWKISNKIWLVFHHFEVGWMLKAEYFFRSFIVSFNTYIELRRKWGKKYRQSKYTFLHSPV